MCLGTDTAPQSMIEALRWTAVLGKVMSRNTQKSTAADVFNAATLNGANSSKIIGGYGLTPVDKDFFDAWKTEYATFSPLKDGLIFEQANEKSAVSQAKEQEEKKEREEEQAGAAA